MRLHFLLQTPIPVVVSGPRWEEETRSDSYCTKGEAKTTSTDTLRLIDYVCLGSDASEQTQHSAVLRSSQPSSRHPSGSTTHTQTQIQFITLTLGISPPVSGRMTAVKCVTRSEQSSQSNQITRKLGERARRHRCLGNVLSDQWSVYGEPQGDERVSLWMSLHGMLHGWVIPQNVCVPRIHLKNYRE